MNKDSKLIAEAYNFVSLKEGIIKDYLVNPLRNAIVKVIAAYTPLKYKVEAFEILIDSKISDYKKYLKTKKYNPEDPEVIKWLKNNESSEKFEEDLYDGFDLFIDKLSKATKLPEQEKTQTIEQLKKLKEQTQLSLDLFKSVNIEDDREKFNDIADKVIRK